MVNISLDHAFVYFIREINSDVDVMIQSMGGVTLPTTYDLAIKAENNLIQVGNISPRPPMTIFLDIHPSMPIHIPQITPLLS
jgi:hypothetical protein